MKWFKIFIIFIFICSCKTQKQYNKLLKEVSAKDSIYKELVVVQDSLNKLDSIYKLEQSKIKEYKFIADSLTYENIKLNGELIVAQYKLGRIKAYCDIVKNNNSQQKYLRGWISRVLED